MLLLTVVLVSACAEIGSPHGARLLDEPSLFVQGPSSPPLIPAEPSDAQVSAQQLRVDIEALRKQRPGLGLGITLIATGGGVTLLGGLYLAASAAAFGAVVDAFLVLGVVGLGLGLPLMVIGVWLLHNRIEARQRIDREMRLLKQQLRQASGPESSLMLANF